MYTLKEIDINKVNTPDGDEKTLFLDQEDYRVKTKDGNGAIQELAVVDENASTPLVYKALLTQTGTDAPVATVLENTLGGTLVWTRDSFGTYFGTLSAAFTVDKTYIPNPVFFEPDDDFIFKLTRIGDNEVRLTSRSSLTLSDDLLYNHPILIEVYP